MAEDIADIILSDNSSQRTPLVLVLDSSGSMINQPIDELNKGLKILEEELKGDTVARTRVQICIIEVKGAKPSVIQDWTDALEFSAPVLEADGPTPLGRGMEQALILVEEQKRRYDNHGVTSTRPWIFMISDGHPTDTGWESRAADCQSAASNKKVAIFPIGVQNADREKLGRFSPTPVKMLEGLKFNELFVWMSRSVSAASKTTPGTKIQQEPTDDWAQIES